MRRYGSYLSSYKVGTSINASDASWNLRDQLSREERREDFQRYLAARSTWDGLKGKTMGSQFVYYTDPRQLPTEPPYRYETLNLSYEYPAQTYAYGYTRHTPEQIPSPYLYQPTDYPLPYAQEQHQQSQPSYAQYQPLYSPYPAIPPDQPSQPHLSQPQYYSYEIPTQGPSGNTSAAGFVQEVTPGSKRKVNKQTTEPSKRHKSSPIKASTPATNRAAQCALSCPPSDAPHPSKSGHEQGPTVIDLTCSQTDLRIAPTPPSIASSRKQGPEDEEGLSTSLAPVKSRSNRRVGGPHLESLAAAKALSRAAATGLVPFHKNLGLKTAPLATSGRRLVQEKFPKRQPLPAETPAMSRQEYLDAMNAAKVLSKDAALGKFTPSMEKHPSTSAASAKATSDKSIQDMSEDLHRPATASPATANQQHAEGPAAAKALSRSAAVGHGITPASAAPVSRSAANGKADTPERGPIMLDSQGQVTTDPDEARTFLPRPLPNPQTSPATPVAYRNWNALPGPSPSTTHLSTSKTPPAPTSSYMPLSSQEPPSSQLLCSSPPQPYHSYGISDAAAQPKTPKGARWNPAADSTSTQYDEAEPRLCAEQEALVELICSGKNVFYTGSAGCGKSTVLKAFTKRLRAMGKKVQIVAPTGRAALQVNGQTTWTYAGWRPEHNRYPLDELLKNAHGERTWRRLNNKTDVLVIDEISMVENFHFGRLSELLKEARHQPHQPKLPFGGLQVIVTGDFCQLPPVNPFEHCFHCGARLVTRRKPYGKVYTCNKHGEFRNEDKWAFRSEAWEECNFVHVQLTQIHRQSDERFVSLLQKCRLGLEFTPEETDILMNHRDKVNRINATQLHATRDTVKQVNDERFAKLKTQCHTFWSLDNVSLKEEDQHLAYKGRIIEDYRAQGVSPPPGRKPRLGLADHRYEPCVQLKQGMLVVLLTNLDLESGLCNGSQGLIAGWEKYDPIKMPSARWSKNEEPGPGMKFSGDHALTKEIQVTNFIKDDATEVKAWPKVRFLNGVVRTIYADCSISEVGERAPYSLLMRTQIPLAPAWAMTIHKSQGMTLNQVIVYLSKAWEEGQVYVALSRATSLEGLKIDGSAAGLKVGLGGNREVQRFMREKFAARDPTVPAGQLTLPPPASQPKFFYDLGPNSRAILP